MKRLMLSVVLAVVAAGLLTSNAWAQPGEHSSRPAATTRPGDGERNVGKFVESLNLTAEQQPKVKEIMEAHRKELRQWRSENGEKMKTLWNQMQEARKAGNNEQLKSLRDQMEKLRAGRRQIDEGTMKELNRVLTGEQMDKVEAFFRHPGFRMMMGLHQLNLTDEQKTKVKQILDDAREKANKTEDPKAKREIMESAMKNIQANVLTDEQRSQMEKGRQVRQEIRQEWRRDLFEKLNMTDEQKAKADKILAEAREKASKTTDPREKREILSTAREDIKNNVLTEQQRTQLKELTKQWQEKRRGPAMGPGGRHDGRGQGRPGGFGAGGHGHHGPATQPGDAGHDAPPPPPAD